MQPRNRADIRKMRRAGRSAARTLHAALAQVRPGISTDVLDAFVARDTAARGGRCAQHGYVVGGLPFPGHLCISPNTVVCHGIPSATTVLQDGDIVNLDVTTELEGWHGDTSRTVFVGEPGPDARHVVEVAERALQVGLEAVRPGAPFAVIGRAIDAFVRSQGCRVIEDYGGHGIGRRMHEPPHVHHHATKADFPRMTEGMTFTIEPMVTLGLPAVRHHDDGWTVTTADGALTAQFEHTVLVTREGVEVLTLP